MLKIMRHTLHVFIQIDHRVPSLKRMFDQSAVYNTYR